MDLIQGIGLHEAYALEIERALDAALEAEDATTSFTLLPILTCQAAGGMPEEAIPAAAAWRALHIAAQLLDDVEDGDVHLLSERPFDIPRLINLATGFIALSGSALTRLSGTDKARLMHRLDGDFHQAVLRVAGGQHLDLVTPCPPDLATYFRVVGLKSGQAFALATRAGALIASALRAQVARYERFGYNVGILVQIADDLAGFHQAGPRGDIAAGRCPLPVVYALEVASTEEALQLQTWLSRVAGEEDVACEVRALVTALGGEAYSMLEIVRYRERALAALQAHSRHDAPLRDWLMRLYDSLSCQVAEAQGSTRH